ncbi:SSPO protein, partial [Alcedo cyanopectus]|nr:SSPO protein [Ceyx cyanopectus]
GQGVAATSSDTPRSVPAAAPCTGGQRYQECGRPCGRSCAERRLDGAGDSCPDLAGLCVPGCQCPAGLVLAEDGQCVPP